MKCLHFVALGGTKAGYARNANGICCLIGLGVDNKFYFYNYVASIYLDCRITWSAIFSLSSVFENFPCADVQHATLPLCKRLKRVCTQPLCCVWLLTLSTRGAITVNFYISLVTFFHLRQFYN